MAKKVKEPQYIMSVLNTPMTNYRVYVMSASERLLYFLLAFIAGGAVGLIFYGGQFPDENGQATALTMITNCVIFLVIGLIAGFVFLPIRCEQLKKKRKTLLSRQFRSLLEALAVSLSTGMNMSESLVSAYNDLKMEYGEKAAIIPEIKEMIDGVENNIPIEDMMVAFGERSEIVDIKNFGTIFEICYRAGGNMKDVVRRTASIISEKIEIAEEIETAITSNKTQFLAMMVIPVILMVLLRVMSTSFAASFATLPGVIAITVAIGLFFAAFKLAQKITNIKG